MVVYLSIWVTVSLVFTLIRAGILDGEHSYTPVKLEDPRRVHDCGLTWFGNLLIYMLAVLVELIFIPYLVIRWVWYKLIIKAGKAAFIKENNECMGQD